MCSIGKSVLIELEAYESTFQGKKRLLGVISEIKLSASIPHK